MIKQAKVTMKRHRAMRWDFSFITMPVSAALKKCVSLCVDEENPPLSHFLPLFSAPWIQITSVFPVHPQRENKWMKGSGRLYDPI